MRFPALIMVVITITLITPALAYDWVQWPVSEGGNDHWYVLTDDYGTWQEAEAEAVSAGDHLVTVNDATENDWLAQTFSDAYCRDFVGDPAQNIAWIGFYNDGGVWKWISGETVTYNVLNVHPASDGPHAFQHMPGHPASPRWGAHDLHDDPAQPGYHPCGIIESLVPEPTTFSFLAVGGLALLRRRR